MKASIIAISFIIATVHAAEQFDPIALGGHDKTDEHPTSALVDFVLDTEASADAGVDTVGKQKSLRGFKTASTRARTRNASTGIEPIDADGTVLGRGIRRAGASGRVLSLADGSSGESDKTSWPRPISSMNPEVSPDTEGAAERIILLGERHSGTNWINDHLEDCFADQIAVTNEYSRFKVREEEVTLRKFFDPTHIKAVCV